jgi:hypothetical protein
MLWGLTRGNRDVTWHRENKGGFQFFESKCWYRSIPTPLHGCGPGLVFRFRSLQAAENVSLPAARHAKQTKTAAGKIPRRRFVWDNRPPVVTGHFRQDRHQRGVVVRLFSSLLCEFEVARGVAARVERRGVGARRIAA